MIPRFLVVVLLLGGAIACRRPPEPPKKAQEPPPPPLFAYLVNCDGGVGRVNLNQPEAPTVVQLPARTTAYLIPAPRGESCSVYHPRIGARDHRLFVIAPQEDGRRSWRILGFRLPDFAFTDAIELDQGSPYPPVILPAADGKRLFVSFRAARPEDAEVVAYNIEHPRAARLLEETLDEVELGPEAYVGPDGVTIYDGEQRVQADGDTDEFSLDNLVGTPEGAGLEPWVSGKGAKRKISAQYADSAGARILYRLSGKDSVAAAVLDTSSDKLRLISPMPATAASTLHLTPDGKRVLVEEVKDAHDKEPDRTGRLAVFDSDSGAAIANWTVPPIAGSSARLLCMSARGQYIFAAQGRLVIFDSRSGRFSERDGGVPLDHATRCVLDTQ